MRRRELGIGLLAIPALAHAARATESGTVRIARQNNLAHLPLMVMQHRRLVEQHAEKLGLPNLQAIWPIYRNCGETIENLLTGQVDFGVLGIPELALLWDRTVGTPGEMRALSAVTLQPFMLVTNNPAVKTLGDFQDQDRIAVRTVRISPEAVCLEMAAARHWGLDQYTRLDPLTAAMTNADAADCVIATRPPVDTHFSISPYYYDELVASGVHLVLKSNDAIGGRHVNGALVVAPYFQPANPMITRAVLAAQREANALIKAHPKEAARIYLSFTQDSRKLSDMTQMVADPDIVWTTVPQRSMAFVTFMHKVGRLQHLPASWKDLFLPDGESGTGS